MKKLIEQIEAEKDTLDRDDYDYPNGWNNGLECALKYIRAYKVKVNDNIIKQVEFSLWELRDDFENRGRIAEAEVINEAWAKIRAILEKESK